MSRENHGVPLEEMSAATVPPALAGPREAVGRHGAAATGHPAASRAALEVLAAGGSVGDAAIAASAMLAVVLPHATSIGGDAFFLVRDAATGQIQGLNASGRAPQAAAAGAFPEGLPQRGARAAVVPGLVKGWEALHARLGCKAWDSLFDPAIRAAQEGFPVGPTLAQSIVALESSLRADPGCAAAFFPAGMALAAGDTFRQEKLAETLAAIARNGAAVFYGGEVGRRLTGRVAAAGGFLRPGDLEGFTADWVTPMTLAFGGHEIAVMPPNSYGVLMLMQLQALAALPVGELAGDTVTRFRRQMRAMQAVFDTALEQVGDPAGMEWTNGSFLAESAMEEVRSRMLGERGGQQPVPGGGTACVTVADADGNAVCIVQSIFNPFGAHYLEPDTGIVLNNRLFGFDHRPGRVNAIGPGKRSAHTLNPVMVTQGGDLRWVYASPGGISQTITGVQVLINLIVRRLGIGAAIDAGRWAVDRSRNILLEPKLACDLLPALRAAGLDARTEEDDYLFGSVTLIQRDPDRSLRAAGDARRHAAAMAY